MQNFAIPYRGIGENREFQINIDKPPTPLISIFTAKLRHNRIFQYFGMQNFAIPYRGIGKNIEFQLNIDIPPIPLISIFTAKLI